MFSIKSLVVTLVAGLALAACAKKEEEAKAPTSAADSTNSYLTDTVRSSNPQDELTLNGTVTFDQDNVVRVFPLVSGNVEKVEAPLGVFVQKGQVLATIRSGDISTYANNYQADKSDLEVAQQGLKTTEAQYKAGFASQTDYLTAKNNVKKAQDELSKSANVLQVYGGSNTSGNPYFTVKAPIAGYVVERNVNAGQDLRSDNQNPLFTISSLQQIWVLANVYEQDIPSVKQGQSVDLQVLAYPSKVFKGTISNISSVLDTEARVLKVRIVLPNQDGLLKPDMFATVHVHLPNSAGTGTGGNSLAVSQKAVVFDRDHYFVVVETAKNKFDVREVNVIQNTTRYAFVSGKLKPGDIVVTEGSLLLYNDLTD